MPAFGAHLFLSADTEDVKRVLNEGYAAATLVSSVVGKNESDELRIAFDGDAVLFSDEAERVYQESGLAAFSKSETDAALRPLSGGPFKEFLAGLHRIQSDFSDDASPIRTALVTARSAPAHERVIRTLRAWNIRIDEALFLGGLDRANSCARSAPTSSSTTSARTSSQRRSTLRPATCPRGVANGGPLLARLVDDPPVERILRIVVAGVDGWPGVTSNRSAPRRRHRASFRRRSGNRPIARSCGVRRRPS